MNNRIFKLVMGGSLSIVTACGSDVSSEGYVVDSFALEDARLPAPDILRVAQPERSEADAARAREVEEFILGNYVGYRILATTQTRSGDIYDWIDPATVPGSLLSPPPDEFVEPEDGDAEDSVRLALTEFDVSPELLGPEGSVPMLRPAFEAYVDGSSGASSLREFLASIPTGQPAGQTRLYGGYRFDDEHLDRAVSSIQQFPGTVSSNTFNILEMMPQCGSGGSLEGVGIVVGRGAAADYGTTGTRLRLQAEFFTAGVGSIGNNIGGWHGAVTGFVGASGAPYSPGVELTFISDVGGFSSDAWSPVEWLLFEGNWWLRHNGNWLGYYPGSLFNLIDADACRNDWYGEVFDPTPTNWTSTNMGSGQFAAAGPWFASYHKNTFYRDLAGNNEWPDASGVPFNAVTNPTPGFNAIGPTDANCYTTSAPNTSGTRFFHLGGPGGDNTGCN